MHSNAMNGNVVEKLEAAQRFELAAGFGSRAHLFAIISFRFSKLESIFDEASRS